MRFLLMLLCLFQSVSAQTTDRVTARLVESADTVKAGETLRIGLELTMTPGWHTYSEDPGEFGMPTRIEWHLPEGVTASPIEWPEPEVFSFAGMESRGYSGTVTLWSELHVSEGYRDARLDIGATAHWIGCGQECIPGQADLFIAVSVTPAESSQLGWTLLFAALGGLILNLMPCVLPVISVKILSFVQMAGEQRSKILLHALAYTFGILICFWSLAGALFLLRSGGEALGWGFHLQSAPFVTALIVILFVLGLSLFGLMELSLPFLPSTGGAPGKYPLLSSFSTGLLTTIVATPCTGPFLGPVLGYAFTLSPLGIWAIFTSMGLGLALPYILLALFPSLKAYVPRPGNWMLRFKEAMGFLMMASVVWLLWVFEALQGADHLFYLLSGLLLLAIALWVHASWRATVLRRSDRSWWSLVAVIVFVAFSATAIMRSLEEPPPMSDTQDAEDSDWEEFNPERIAALRAEGTPIFIDFTARWCLICQANKPSLRAERVTQRFEELGVARMEADWTRRDAVITRWLEKFGRSGVPLYVLYPRKGEAVILPQTLTPDIILSYLDELEPAVSE